MADYLHACLDAFGEVSERLYGTRFDLAAIEHTVAPLQRRPLLTYKDLAYFVAPEHWWFEKFWVFPPEDKVTPALARQTFDFWNLPRNQDRELAKLLEVFRSIELVSIILRFVKPAAYGIISPPVERVLDVRRGSDARETYRNYLDDLREIQRHYRFARAADADMALWVLHERCFGTLRDAAIEAAWAADRFMLRLRAKNLVGHLLAGRSYAEFADALEASNPELAAVVACYAFELKLRALAERRGIVAPRAFIKLGDLIDAFAPVADPIRRGEWKRLKGFRDALFHEGRRPRVDQTAALIREVHRLERDLAAPPLPKPRA
ncbi:MAG TPA: hypothetical protein VFL90_01585 [Methylomirabilota bacterium]|nr:hypothetical protein [Methylomirabilota bacterium]